MDLNKAMIIGRLTQDPELKNTPGGQSVCRFSVATNFAWTDAQGQKQERVEYHNIVVWRRLAEICMQYLSKGRRVYIEGRLQTSSWQDQNGVTKYKTEIITDNLIMLDGGKEGHGGGGAPAPAKPSAAENAQGNNDPFGASPKSGAKSVSDDEIRIEDIPF